MTSFIQTMLVNPSPPRSHFPHQPRPLPALHCNVLAASTSCSSLQFPESPQSSHQSPLQKHFRDVLDNSPLQSSLFGFSRNSNNNNNNIAHSPTPKLPKQRFGGSREKKQPLPRSNHHHKHRNTGLGDGLDEISIMADIFTYDSNANARNRGTFRPHKAQKGTNSWQLKQFAEATLGSGSLKKVVQLPEGEDKDEWLAVNVVDFYNQINLIYGAITEFCSPQSCPEMKATDEFEYLWHHPPEYARPTRLPAPSYISNLLTWTSNLLSDTNLFPTQPGVPFPASFQSTIKQIFKRLYRIYAHIYCHHYGVIRGLGLEAHLNTGFKHYVLFVEEFGLADEGGKKEAKAEWYGPLGELVDSMLRSD